MVRRAAMSVLLGALYTVLSGLMVYALGWPLDMNGVAVVLLAGTGTQWVCFWARDRGGWW